MVLVDTSVWIDHFRRGNKHLARLLLDRGTVIHPYIIGELACGDLSRRAETLDLLRRLPHLDPATHDEVLLYVENHRLYGVSLGYIDIHLLAAAEVSGASVWTLDKTLRAAARRRRRAYETP